MSVLACKNMANIMKSIDNGYKNKKYVSQVYRHQPLEKQTKIAIITLEKRTKQPIMA